jgi:NitT/TauT family transport system substrate-binding protein
LPLRKSALAATTAAAAVLASLGSAIAADKMTITLNFLAQPAQAGFFLAKEKGFYTDVDIDLKIVEGKSSSTTAQITAAGQNDIGFLSGPAAISFINQGAPLKIIAAVIQGNFQALASLDRSNIRTPIDLKGKTIAVCPGCAQLPMIKGLLTRAGINQTEVKIQNIDQVAHISMLEEGKIDVVAGDPNTISVEMEERGQKVHNMFFKDWGIGLINYVLAAREDRLKEKPDMYRRFLAASLKGWRAIKDDPEGAITALQKQYPEIKLNRHTLLRQLNEGIVPFVCVEDTPGIGKASPALWSKTYEIMTNYMGLKPTVDVTKVHTEEFLPATLPACK